MGDCAHAGEQRLIASKCGRVATGEVDQLRELLLGEGKIIKNIGRQSLLGGHRIGHVQERARCRYHHALRCHQLLDAGDQRILLCIVGPPDVLAVHDTSEEQCVLGEARLQQFERLLSFHEVETDAIEAECHHITVHIADIPEIRLKEHLQSGGMQSSYERGIDRLEQCPFLGGHVEHQCRLSDAHPCSTLRRQLSGNPSICFHSRLGEVDRLFLSVVTGQAQEGVRSYQCRHRLDTQRLSLPVVAHRLVTL